MSITSKSPAAVLRVALDVAKQAFPAYSHRCIPKKFTKHQLFACLVLKNFLKTDYRGVTGQDCSSLQDVLGLKRVPHYTMLQKPARRLLLSAHTKKLLDATVRKQLGRRRRVPLAAIDSTGMECTAASGYRRSLICSFWC